MNKIKLFCIPYAGGSAQAYLGWRKWLHPQIELHAVELAGRGKRAGVSLYKCIEDAVEDIYLQILPAIDNSPIAFLGHSMGSLLVYEVLWKMQKAGKQDPSHVFFSGRYPPYLVKNQMQTYLLPDEEFVKFLSSEFEIIDNLPQNRELLDFIIPVIRNDIMLVETFRHNHDLLQLRCPVTVMTGIHDKLVNVDDCRKWALCTSGSFIIRKFDSGHFFIRECKESVVGFVNEMLMNPMRSDVELLSEHRD